MAMFAPSEATRAMENQVQATRPSSGGLQRADAAPGSDEEQVDADGVGPGFPAVLSGSGGDVVQVGEGQGAGDDGLYEHGVEADRAHEDSSFRELGPGGSRRWAARPRVVSWLRRSRSR